MHIAPLVLGSLLLGLGSILTLSAVPFTGWNASWARVKRDFHTMLHHPRFQTGAACCVIGFLLLMCCLWPVMP